MLLPAAEVKPMSRHVAVSYQVPVYDRNGKTFHQRQPYRLRTMRTIRAAADSGEQQAAAELPTSVCMLHTIGNTTGTQKRTGFRKVRCIHACPSQQYNTSSLM